MEDKTMKTNDIVRFTPTAIAENCRLFGKSAMLRNERGRKYKVKKIVTDKYNQITMVYLTDTNGHEIQKFECGVFIGHLELAN